MVAPPLLLGAVKETSALSPLDPAVPVALTEVGAPGVEIVAWGVTSLLTTSDPSRNGELEPAALVATTLNRYDVPFERPVTVQLVSVVVVQVSGGVDELETV